MYLERTDFLGGNNETGNERPGVSGKKSKQYKYIHKSNAGMSCSLACLLLDEDPV